MTEIQEAFEKFCKSQWGYAGNLFDKWKPDANDETDYQRDYSSRSADISFRFFKAGWEARGENQG